MKLIKGKVIKRVPLSAADTGELFDENYTAPEDQEIMFNPDDILNAKDLKDGTAV